MDVNGTRFHLVHEEAGWTKRCWEADPAEAFADVVEPLPTSPPALRPRHTGWDSDAAALTLRPELALFRPEIPLSPLPLSSRRGAARDRFGNWYWIGHDQRTLFWMP